MSVKRAPGKNALMCFLALAIFFAATMYLLYPRSIRLTGYLHDGPDPKVLIWTLTWVQYQLFHDPAHLYRANIFYPHDDALAYSDNFLAQALLALPLLPFSSEPTFVYNASFLIAFTLSGFAMFLLARSLTGNWFLSVVAGFFYAFSPYRLDNITHLQYASHQWLPLALWAFIGFFRSRKRRWAAAAAAFLALQALSCATYLVMFSLPLGLFLVFMLIAHPLDGRSLVALLAAGILLCLLLIPFYYPYWKITQELGLGPVREEVLRFSPDLLDYAKQPKYMVSYPYRLLPQHIKADHFSLFPGFLASAAILFAFATFFIIRPWDRPGDFGRFAGRAAAFKRSRTAAFALTLVAAAALAFVAMSPDRDAETGFTFITGLLWLALLSWLLCAALASFAERKRLLGEEPFLLSIFLPAALLCGLMALGPLLHVGARSAGQNVYWPLFAFAPGFKSIRQVMHFDTFFILFAVPAAALALHLLRPKRKAVAAVLGIAACLWLAFEYRVDTSFDQLRQKPDYVKVPTGGELPAMFRWLAERPPESPHIILPAWPYPHHQESDRMYWSMYHWRPMVTGQSSYWPVEYENMVARLADFPSKGSLEFLQNNYKLRFLILHIDHFKGRLPDGRTRLEAAEALLSGPESHYKLEKKFDHFWVFANIYWNDSYFYNVAPPKPGE